METIKISNLQEGDLFIYKGVMYEIVYIRTNGKPIVNMSIIKVVWDGFQVNIFIVNLVIIQK